MKISPNYTLFVTVLFCLSQPAIASQPSAPKLDVTALNNAEAYRAIYLATPPLAHAFIDSSPENHSDGLATGKLKKPSPLIALAKEIESGQWGEYDSLLIAHNNKLVFESYFAHGRVDLPHYQASATKGYTALAVGRAIQMGYLTMEELHQPVIKFLKEVEREKLIAGTNQVTLHHTLSMRSGLNIAEEQKKHLSEPSEYLNGQQLAQAYFTRTAPITEETQTYHYQGEDPELTMLTLDAILPSTAKEFIHKELLVKLGINNFGWQASVSGTPKVSSGSYMTSRDMLKWAILLKDDGKWQGEQLISQPYLAQATGSIATPVDPEFDYSNFRYGYYFWGTTLNVNGKSYDAKLAWGGGGQMVIAIKALDLAIAITARMRDNSKIFELLEKRVLPNFIQ